MKVPFKILNRDKIVKRSFILSVLLLLLTFGYLLVLYKYLPPLVPIFNQLAWGTERLGDKMFIFLPLLITFVILIVNLIFSQIIYEKMPLVVRMISITTFFISLITLIFVIRTTLLIL